MDIFFEEYLYNNISIFKKDLYSLKNNEKIQIIVFHDDCNFLFQGKIKKRILEYF